MEEPQICMVEKELCKKYMKYKNFKKFNYDDIDINISLYELCLINEYIENKNKNIFSSLLYQYLTISTIQRIEIFIIKNKKIFPILEEIYKILCYWQISININLTNNPIIEYLNRELRKITCEFIINKINGEQTITIQQINTTNNYIYTYINELKNYDITCNIFKRLFDDNINIDFNKLVRCSNFIINKDMQILITKEQEEIIC